jgi:class 3 adenylate cyclase
MFADICRSTHLYSELGDDRAAALVNSLLAEATAVVTSVGGRVIRSMGDDVLCTFEQPAQALQAAAGIHEAVRRFSDSSGHNLALRIGMNTGTVILHQDDILGDTVNMAARVAAIAKARQTVVSPHTVDQLEQVPEGLIRPLAQVTLKGKAGPVPLFEFLDTNSAEDITEVGSALQFPKSDRLLLHFQSQDVQLDYRLVRFLMGRAPECDLVMEHPLVSRHHAEIRYLNNEFVLLDFSTNGTELVIGGQTVPVHHGQRALRGQGSIYLGRTSYNRSFEIAFDASGGSKRIS